MNETSGNPCALLDARPVNDDTPHAVWNKLSFETAYKFYDTLYTPVWAKRGLVKFPHNVREINRFDKILNGTPTLGSFEKNEVSFISQEDATNLLGIPAPSDGLYYPNGGAVYPHKIREALSTMLDITKTSVQKIHCTDRGWRIITDTGIYNSDIVILSTGYKINDLSPYTMPHTVTRGQISIEKSLPNQPRMPTSRAGYILPMNKGFLIGATSQRNDTDTKIRDEDKNTIAAKTAILSGINTPISPHSRVGFRSNPANRMPWAVHIDKNFYIVAGMGSRGFINAPLCAYIIKSMILKEKLPIDKAILQATLYDYYGI